MTISDKSWSFAEIEAHSPDRAASLRELGDLAFDIKDMFERAIRTGEVRLGLEQAIGNSDEVRAVVQFHIGEVLFDRFFNSREGYRAAFRNDWRHGYRFNSNLVGQLRDCLSVLLGSTVSVTRLNANFETVREEQIPSTRLLESLVPDMSKLCYCSLRIACRGSPEPLAVSFSGPKLLLDQGARWAAPHALEADAWLDLKGAFLGSEKPYQPKDPDARARKLAKTGEF